MRFCVVAPGTDIAPTTRGPFYLPQLDGLRFFAFLMVFVHHALPQQAADWRGHGVSATMAEWIAAFVKAGGFGVDVFFTLSAYLITELLVRELEITGKLALLSFYTRRALRIWPLYYAFLSIFVVYFLARHHFDDFRVYAISFACFVGNWVCGHRGYPFSAVAPLWSISIEEQFYLLWPLLLSFVGARRLVAVSVVAIGVAIAARLALVSLHEPYTALWCYTPSRLDPIAVGILAVPLVRKSRMQVGLAIRMLLVAFCVLSMVVTMRFIPIHDVTWVTAVVSYPLVAIGALALLLSVTLATEQPEANGARRDNWLRFLSTPLLVFLGRISYGLYVFHGAAIYVISLRTKQPVTVFFGALTLTTALAIGSFYLLERPFLRIKKRFTVVESRPGG